MPKDKEPLTPSEIELIRQWIAEGAKDDTPDVGRRRDRRRASAGLRAAAGAHGARFLARRQPAGRLAAITKCCCTRPTARAWSAGWSACRERIESVAFSPDGKSLAVTGGSPGRLGEVQIWDVADAKLKLFAARSPTTRSTASAGRGDGTKVAFGCADNTLRAIDAATGKQVLFQGAHSDWVLDTVFSNDGTYLISVSRDRSMKLIEVATQRFVDNITSITPGALKGGLVAVDRHPQKDELLIGGADGVPKIYQMFRTKAREIGDDFNLIKAYEAMPGRIYAVHFNADGSTIRRRQQPGRHGEVRIYETDSGKLLHKLDGQHGAGVRASAFSPMARWWPRRLRRHGAVERRGDRAS